jgi:hypothetical protein
MSHFHVVLPSDSSFNYYPNNTVARYVTKLSDRIRLDGDYEVGLSEIIYPYSWFNVDNSSGNLWFEIFNINDTDDETVKCVLKSGFYSDGARLAKDLTDHIAEKCDWQQCHVAFGFNPLTRRMTMKLWFAPGTILQMSPEFAAKFGFESVGPYTEDSYEAERVLDLNAGVNLLYVYCDIAAYTAVGDTKAPLLRVCHVQGTHGELVRTIYTHPHYVPVGIREFDTIEININTERGLPMPFQFGKSVVTLHFRRRHNLLTTT